jgi:eukaryotic-like serine/threonine-protein kinase
VEIMHFRELTDRYSLDKILRSSRTGTVLRATDSRSGQTVAVKLVTLTSPAELMSRAPWFEKLAAALETLRHPNLPLVLDSGFTTEGSAFLVMELLDGRTLDTAAGAPVRLLALLYQVLDGLEALARRGLAHHNLSPDNLLVVANEEPEPERIKILGLGSAIFRAAGPGPSETARFRAPELLEPTPGERADWHADLYSFAATACHVLGATIAAGDSQVVQLPFALSLELDHSEALRSTLERALRRHPAERPSHQELRDAFRLSLGAAVPPPLLEKPVAPKLVIPAAPAAPAPPQAPAAAPAAPVRPAASVPPRPIPPPQTSPPASSPSPSAGTPPPAAPDLEGTGGELLSAIDDDLLNALSPSLSGPAGPAAGAPPPAPAGNVVPFQRRAGAPMAASVAEKPPDAASTMRRSIILIAVAFGLILAVGIAYWWVSRGAVPPPAPVVAAPLPPPPPPRRPAADVLHEAQLAFADGDDGKALDLLRTLNSADESKLGADGCRALQSLHGTLLRSALDHLADNLARGFKGDLGRLRFAVSAVAGQEAAIPEAVRADFDRARGLVELYNQIEAASGRDAHTEVLERFAILEQDLPKADDPLGLRDRAAAALEEEAEALARDGKYQDAASHLEPLQRTWPERAGLKARLDGYQSAQKDEEAQGTLLGTVLTLESRHQYDDALEQVNSVTPTPHLAPQFDEARKRIEDALAQVDGKAPQVVLRDGYYLDYDRGRVVQLSFRITDDFKVKSVKFMAGVHGGKMRQVPLTVNHLFYTVEIPPSLHRNETMDFYVVATDVSGHEGYFGTPDQPKQLKRREGFKRLL